MLARTWQDEGDVQQGDREGVDVTRTPVTVLIDNYNYDRFLGAAVDSALAQTHSPVDVLVVDDGSTDASGDVLAGYGDLIRVLRLANGGQAAALNRALPHVRGELLVVLDSDDLLDPDAVQRIVAAFDADHQCVRVQYRLRVIDEAGQPTGRLMPPRAVPLLHGDLRPRLLRHRGWRWPPTSGNAWRTVALRQVPAVPEVSFRQAIDRWWCDLVSLLGTVAALDEPAGSYRVHARNHSASEGTGERYLQPRIQRRQELHEASARVAATLGLDYPQAPEQMLDAQLAGWVLADRKKRGMRQRGGRVRPMRALHATLVQPNVPVSRRAAHAAWYLALLAAPAEGRVAGRLVDARYRAG